MEDIYSLITQIEKHPGMYIRKNILSLLVAYLDGYIERNNANVMNLYNNTYLPYELFRSWLSIYFNDFSERRIDELILFYCNNDEREGVKLFYSLLAEFKMLSIEKVVTKELTDTEMSLLEANKDKLVQKERDWKKGQNNQKVFFVESQLITGNLYVYSLSFANKIIYFNWGTSLKCFFKKKMKLSELLFITNFNDHCLSNNHTN